MKKSRLLLLLTILLPISITNSSCDLLSKECISALAELTTEIAIATTTIPAGTGFKVPNLIKNALSTIDKCKEEIATIRAGRSRSRLKIDYDSSNNSNFSQNVLDNNFDIPEIEPGAQAQETYEFSFDEPGEYRLITFADDTDVVEEGDEDNNASAPETLVSGKFLHSETVKKPLIIRVLPNPKFKRPKGEPFVRLLSRTVEIN